MLQVNNLILPVGGDEALLRQTAAKALRVPQNQLQSLTLHRQSIDARKKTDVRLVCAVRVTLKDEAAVLRRAPKGVAEVADAPYVLPPVRRASSTRPVVVGMGPAGLFAALFLARNGLAPIILERGRPVEERTADVNQFWTTGTLKPNSNVQFGEGGAGTFSDGKLTTGTHNPRISTVLKTLAAAGAPADICWQHKPHIGTDILRQVVRNIRDELRSLGCDIRFEHQLTGLRIRDSRLEGLQITGPQGSYDLPCDALILAPGHSARDTFQMLLSAGVPMEAKPFAIGVRIEHPQALISQAQFGPAWEKLPAADYKLACHLPNGRSAFTFCVCPGGQVVAAASERAGETINGGFLVGVSPADFGGAGPLAGAAFQRRWEEAAFALGGGGFRAPVQMVGDFLAERASRSLGAIVPTYRPGVTPADLSNCLPEEVASTLRGALPLLDRKLRGFAAPEAVLTGVETRSSSPVRILRGEDFHSAVRGLYPCGEGAGYAGGITSAAVDGIRVAEAVAGG